LGEVTAANGAMRMAPGSHLTGETLPAIFGTGTSYLEELRPSTVTAIRDPEDEGMEVETIDLGPGEVSLHHSLTWHASLPNVSDQPRRSIVVRFVGDGTIWLGSRRYEFNYSDSEVGCEIGEPISGRYFPIVPF
jgi:ectoine hydroxylase-related dioxygenase (phytanoyl-CoA dioxygenase family)